MGPNPIRICCHQVNSDRSTPSCAHPSLALSSPLAILAIVVDSIASCVCSLCVSTPGRYISGLAEAPMPANCACPTSILPIFSAAEAAAEATLRPACEKTS